MPHPGTHRFHRLLLTPLLCGLLWLGLVGVSWADNLAVSSVFPTINFDDLNTAENPDWQITADELAFDVYDPTSGRTPFRILPGAPSCSICISNTGNVGLGTFSPVQKLHLVQDLSPTIRLEQAGGQIGPFPFPPQTWDLQADDNAFLVRDVTHNQEPLVIRAGAPVDSLVIGTNGNLGLKTPSPQGNLHIFGSSNQDIFNGLGPDLNSGPAFNFGYSGNSFGAGTGFFNVRGNVSGVNPSLRFATVNQQRLIITNAGRVGIGTLAPAQLLDVAGSVHATSFIAGSTTLNVPDYVFAPDYKLRPLSEVRTYVEKERHLPDIPSAQEIKEQGVNLSALQMQLLKKVEELTLYAVAQEKTIDTLKHENAQLQERLSTVEAMVKKLVR